MPLTHRTLSLAAQSLLSVNLRLIMTGILVGILVKHTELYPVPSYTYMPCHDQCRHIFCVLTETGWFLSGSPCWLSARSFCACTRTRRCWGTAPPSTTSLPSWRRYTTSQSRWKARWSKASTSERHWSGTLWPSPSWLLIQSASPTLAPALWRWEPGWKGVEEKR